MSRVVGFVDVILVRVVQPVPMHGKPLQRVRLETLVKSTRRVLGKEDEGKG